MIRTSSTCGTRARRAPRRPPASSNPRFGIGIIITADALRARGAHASRRSPSACRSSTSSRLGARLVEAQHLRAQSADRPRRDLEQHDAGADRRGTPRGSGRGAARARAAPRCDGRRAIACARAGVERRRRDVDRLLEERAVERIGLVEDRRRRCSAPAVSTPSTAYSRPGMKPSTSTSSSSRRACRRARPARASSARIRPSAATNSSTVVGANHAAAARQAGRLEHARERQARIARGIATRSTPAATTKCHGTIKPGRREARRAPRACRRWLRAASADCRAARAAAAARAASTVGRSPTDNTRGERAAPRPRARSPSSDAASSWKRTGDRRDRATDRRADDSDRSRARARCRAAPRPRRNERS